jgi:multidrug efflux pump subunit AcrB
VAFGNDVEQHLQQARATFPPDIRFHRITDQPKVVNDSVLSFLKDILISIIVVIAVMLLLFPLRTALVASTGVPVCIAVCIGLMYITGIELNTVTLAALIFVLGMIVDDSVIVIDGYTDMLEKGHSRWYSAAVSTKQLFVPMALATCAISGMFFPMTKIINGPLGDFIQLFPMRCCLHSPPASSMLLGLPHIWLRVSFAANAPRICAALSGCSSFSFLSCNACITVC